MQHAGLQYGQGAATSHQSPPFAHADISQTTGGNTTSSLRQFRKKDGTDKNSNTDLNTSIENSHIARVPPHNHYPARPNDYYRYQHQYPDYNSPYKETPAQVKYSEIAETPPQPIQHVDHLPAALQKHKEVHKDFMDMCNISQQTHMKQNYPDNLSRQQSYPPDASTVHHQYLHKEPQVHPGYKPESQYQQYPQIPKYNMPSQCRKYPPPPPPPENDFLAKLQRINPSMARSIMSDHHIRESQATYPSMEQNRMYPQNQRYYPPAHLQNNLSYNYQPYNYSTSSCNYKHPEYQRPNQMAVGGAQYPTINPHTDRSISPRNLHMMNYGTSPQKISPNYSQYNPPEYAQHYQHRRASLPQDYYQQACRVNPYMGGHQISPEPNDNRTASGGLRHFIENWAEEEGSAEITPIFKENIRIHNNDSSNEQVFVINSSDIPQCLENVSLVPTENGQYIIKSGALDNSVVRIKETTESNGERTVNLQIVEAAQKADCMLAEESAKTTEEPPVPYQENQKEKVCDEETKSSQPVEEQEKPEEIEETPKSEESSAETSVIVSNEVSVIKDMPIIDEEHAKNEEEKEETAEKTPEATEKDTEENHEDKVLSEESHVTTTTKRTQRIFSVDDIINNIGTSPTETRRNSLQFVPQGTEETNEEPEVDDKEESEEEPEEMEYRSAISVEDDSVILEIGGAWVQLNINYLNGTKVLSVLPLSDSLVIDVNGNYQEGEENEDLGEETVENELKDVESIEETLQEFEEDPQDVLPVDQHLEDISGSVYQSEIVIGEESMDNDVFLDLQVEEPIEKPIEEPIEETLIEEVKKPKEIETYKKRDDKRKSKEYNDRRRSSSKKVKTEERKDSEERSKEKKTKKVEEVDPKIARKKTESQKAELRKDANEEIRKKESSASKKERRVSVIEEAKKKDEDARLKKQDKKLIDEDDSRKKDIQEQVSKSKRIEKRLTSHISVIIEEEFRKKEMIEDEKKVTAIEDVSKNKETLEENIKSIKRDKKLTPQSSICEEEEKKKITPQAGPVVEESEKKKEQTIEEILEESPKLKQETPQNITDRPKASEEVKKPEESKEEAEKPPTKAAKKLYLSSPFARPRNEENSKPKIDMKRSMSKLEETVNKIKSLKEKIIKDEERSKKTSMKDTVEKKTPKVVKKVTFSLDTEVREINKEEMDKKKLSWEEYHSRKRRSRSVSESEEMKNKIMEDTVTSSDDINDEVVEKVEISIENAIKDSVLKKSPPRMTPSNWENDTPSPQSPAKDEVMSTTNRKCIIDVNEFNIKPIESVSTPSPVSSSQFSYHSEDDSLQVYKDVVDSKLNSLNIRIPKLSKPKPVDRFSVLLDRFLNKGTLNCEELEEVKKFIEIKRKMLEEEKKLTYEVKGERDYKDLKLHFRKVPEKRKKKRFRNLYTEDSSDDSDSSRSDKTVGNYSVYQRDSQGVPKLIFKRKSGLPQPFVKLERSQAVEMMAKKRKLY